MGRLGNIEEGAYIGQVNSYEQRHVNVEVQCALGIVRNCLVTFRSALHPAHIGHSQLAAQL